MARELPPQLKRMAITREATTDFALAPFPGLPKAFVNRFPDLAPWDLKIEEWIRRTEGDLRRLSTDLREFREPVTETVVQEVFIPPPPSWDDIVGKPECFPSCEEVEPWSFTVNGV